MALVGSSHQKFPNFGAEALYAIDSSSTVLFPSGECAIQSSVLQQQNQVYLKIPPNPPGNYTITVQYQGNNSTTPLILDYFVVGDL
jgi:hypothetical protein